MSESLSIDEGWEESLDSEQVTHVKGEIAAGIAPAGEWLVNVSEQVVVPMTTVDVVDALRSRRVTERSLVWRAGMQDWTPLGEVPQLRLAAGPLAAATRTPTTSERAPMRSERASAPPSERTLRPPPKEPARAARDERARRNTLPFGFPVVRDPATIREPAGLHPAPAQVATAPVPAAAVLPSMEDVDALAIYERATPSLTFSDSVRAEWQGTGQLVHQPAPSPPPAVIARPAPRPRIAAPAEPRLEPKARLTLEPQSDPRPRLSLEPQSDPLQTARVEQPFKLSGSQPPSSLAPTTSEPDNELPARGAGMWGDLSVVLASDMRAAKQSSKRVTLIASLGSAALASLLTLWFAHSSSRAPERPATPTIAAATQPAPAITQAQTDTITAPAAVAPLAPPAAPSAQIVAHAAPAVHAAPKPAPRVVSRPKPEAQVAAEPASTSADGNPYADPSDPPAHVQKTPTAAFKETNLPSAEEPTHNTPSVSPPSTPPNVSSGLEDNASQTRPAPTAAPGF